MAKTCRRCFRDCQPEDVFCSRCGFDLRYGVSQRARRGVCIYCERYCELSDEHIYGAWLDREFLQEASVHRHTLSRPIREAIEAPLEVRSTSAMRRPYSEKVRNVCEQCNNGWMSGIYEAARAETKMLANGFWPRFSDEQASFLSRWALMVSINLECKGRVRSVSQAQRTALMNGRMPDGVRVSISKLRYEPRAWDWVRAFSVPDPETGSLVNGQSTFFKVEHIAFHVISVEGKGFELLEMERSFIPRLPRQIWPTNEGPLIRNKISCAIDDLVTLQLHMGWTM